MASASHILPRKTVGSWARKPLVNRDRAPPEGDSEHDCNWGMLHVCSTCFSFPQALSSICSFIVRQLVTQWLCIAVLKLARRMIAASKTFVWLGFLIAVFTSNFIALSAETVT